MNDLSVLRATLKQTLPTHIMKSKQRESKEVSITVDKIWELAIDTWNKVRSSKLTIRVDPI
jgi:hypothetical protein